MRNFITPIQDASVYQQFPDRNSGLDEILDVGKTTDGTNLARSLVQFDLSIVSASLANNTIPITAQFELLLYVASAEKLKASQQVQICQINQNWSEGTGYFYQDITQINDGVTWNQNQSGSFWFTGSAGGSVTALSQSNTLTNPISDISIDVTDTVLSWVSGAAPNYGFLVKFDDDSEQDVGNLGLLHIFSKDTHTIYRPQLIVKWNSQVYQTGSLTTYPTSSLVVIPASLRPEYRMKEIVRVDLAVRERYPLKTFDTVFTNYDGLKYLPSSSYYSIIDEQSNTIIIPFDQYASVNCDTGGSYIVFGIQNMYPLRYYRLLVRIDHNGLSEIFDTNAIFTIRQ